MMEIGYLDGETPSLICWLKNRNDDKSFNSINVAYNYGNTGKFGIQWIAGSYGAEAHQFRVEDVDYDGKDEILHMGYALNSDGSFRYRIDEIVHGDRYHIAPFSNADNGKEMLGYAVQQNNESGLLELMYNASTGEVLWKNYAPEGTADVGRGDIGDVDPTYDGYECWSFQGMYTIDGTKISDATAYPCLKLYWDGDLLSDSYNDSKIEKWHYDTKTVERLDTTYRFVTFAQDSAYRNDMTSKRYVQSNMLSFYLGTGMDTPPQPDMRTSSKLYRRV